MAHHDHGGSFFGYATEKGNHTGGTASVPVRGALAGHCFAFERAAGERRVLALLPFRTAGLLGAGGTIRTDLAADSTLGAAQACWRDAFDTDGRHVNPLESLTRHGVSVCWA